jgi:ABC-type iron transport system FetAB permease component
MPQSKQSAVSLFLAILLLLMLGFPFLSIFNVPETVGGIPLLFLYVGVLWMLFILCAWVIWVRKPKRSKQHE